MIPIGKALLACALCLGFGVCLGMFFMACCVVSGRADQDEQPPRLSVNDRIWMDGQ